MKNQLIWLNNLMNSQSTMIVIVVRLLDGSRDERATSNCHSLK